MRYSSFVVFLFMLNQICSAGIINIPADSKTLQGGIEMASAGDTILVPPGAFPGPLEIDSPISLIGADWESSVIYGMYTGTVILVTSNSASVEKLSIIQAGSNDKDAGIKLAYVDSCKIDSCKLYDNGRYGLALRHSWHNTISNCMIYGNEHGIGFIDEDDPEVPLPHRYNFENQVVNNYILNNGRIGIVFGHADYHQQNLVSGNYIACNMSGMYMVTSQENEISDNTFYNNTEYGIYFSQCMCGGNDNVFHHNSFVDNTGGTSQSFEVMDYGNNLWYGSGSNEGNYWSDYTGSDGDEDGIGDEPYLIDGPYDTQDLYPLMSSTAYVRGDANGDMKINVGDPVFIINYVFRSGAAPEPLLSGDANWDDGVDVGDAVYLINYIFKGGSPPCGP